MKDRASILILSIETVGKTLQYGQSFCLPAGVAKCGILKSTYCINGCAEALIISIKRLQIVRLGETHFFLK